MLGESEYTAQSAIEGLHNAYQREETDEFVEATAILNAQGEATSLADNDAVVFMNFRADRAREICQAITDTDF